MRRLPAIAVVMVLVLITPALPRGAAAPDFASPAVALLERWNTAVREHNPGMLDRSITQITAITYADRRILDGPMRVFLSVLAGRPYAADTELQQKVDKLARASRAEFGYETFLKRAVVLHTDAAIAREADPPELLDPRPLKSPLNSPLLDTRRMSINRDGEIRGELESDWNWPFARSLADAIHAAAPGDAFPGDWYHMAAAYMFSRMLYAEVTTHLTSAARVLPADARILFDRGVYAEIQSLPINQVLLRGVDLYRVRQLRDGRRPAGPTTDATRRVAALDVPLKADALAEADRHFRRALKVSPSFTEARVRLARVLIEDARYVEAQAELRTALGDDPTGEVAFYAHLFAGRAAQRLAQYDDAGRHFDAAGRLFPAAQSARLARSQLALLRADASGAVEPLERLPPDPAPDDLKNDPWTYYRLAVGRHWDALYGLLVKRK